MSRRLVLSLFLIPLSASLFLGCSGEEETAGPGTELKENVETAVNAIEEKVEKLVAPHPQLDLAYITDDFTSAVIVHPGRLLKSDFMNELVKAGLPLDKFLKACHEKFGIDPLKVDQLVVLGDQATIEALIPFGGPPGGSGIPQTDEEPLEQAPESDERGSIETLNPQIQMVAFQEEIAEPFEVDAGEQLPILIVRFSEDIDVDEFFNNPNLLPMEEAEIDGLKAKKTGSPTGVFYFPNPKTLIVTRPTLLKKMVDTKSASSELISELKKIDASYDLTSVTDMMPLRPLMQLAAIGVASQVPPQLAMLASIPAKTKMLTWHADIHNETLLSVTFTMDSTDDVTEINPVLTNVLELARDAFEQQKTMGLPPGVPFSETELKELMETADKLVKGITNKADGNRLTISIPNPGNLNRLAALMKPAFKELKKRDAMTKQMNNLHNIVICLHNYSDVHRAFPGAGSDASGEKKGLSWRVHLLPELYDQDGNSYSSLYEQFHLDEPWDSEHNQALISKMPEIFRSRGVEDPTKTSIHMFADEKAFPEVGGKSFKDVTDGTTVTIFLVEAGPDKAEVWTKPGGLELNETDPFAALGNLTEDHFLAAFVDNSVRPISTSIAPETLKALITINGGEPVGDF